jgi:hypothetical protein
MRFAILGISHETNTFSKVPADYEQFVARGSVLRGPEIVASFEGSNYTIAGYLEACKELGVEAVSLMWAGTGPVGTITKDAYERLSSEMFARAPPGHGRRVLSRRPGDRRPDGAGRRHPRHARQPFAGHRAEHDRLRGVAHEPASGLQGAERRRR